MFSRLATVRINSAEAALAGGRLDEAVDLLTAPDLAGQKRVSVLLERAADALLDRGQENMMQRRFAEALADFQRAGRCGHRTDKAAEWRCRAETALREARIHEQGRTEAVADAKRRLSDGSLAGARDALARLQHGDPQRIELDAAIARQAGQVEQLLRTAAAALQRDDVAAAAEAVTRARALHPKAHEVADMETQVVERAVERAKACYETGRLDQMQQALAALAELGRSQRARVEADELLRLAGDAARAINEGRYARADVALGRLVKIGPSAAWLATVRAHVEALEQNRRAILEGPLGLLTGKDANSLVSARAVDPAETLAAPRRAPLTPPPALVPPTITPRRRLLLRIDGVGSFLLLRGDRVSIGRAGPSASADLPLVSDLSERQAEIVRAGEDYFIVSGSGVELAGRPVDYALLQDGDRVRLGRRVKLTFTKPSLKSNSAVLELGEGVRTTTDCRRVILWDGPLLLGSKRECHVPLAGTNVSAVLLERDGGYCVKVVGPNATAVPLPLDETIEFAGLTMSLRAWNESNGAGRVIG